MDYINRHLTYPLKAALERGKSILLLGARQTGKTTLTDRLKAELRISLIQPAVRQYYEINPSLFTGEIEALAEKYRKSPLVIVDEVQKVPLLMDVIQDLIDRKIAQFILTGSSARKLRAGSKVNLLPGRVVVFRLDPLTFSESRQLNLTLEDLLLYGSLPGIVTINNPHDREQDLASYVTIYLEEEIRAEALVRNVASFSKFLTLAAAESGNLVNFRKLSQEIGIAHTTIASYYQILEDCLVAERIEPLTHTKTRRRLIKTPKYILFDLGIRRLSAGEGTKLPAKYLGLLFEQWVGLELIRCARWLPKKANVYFWRDTSGPEVDWVLEKEGVYTPLEVKWTNHPTQTDIKHLELFRTEYSNVGLAYIVCQVPKRIKLTKYVYALPWQELDSLMTTTGD